MTSEIRANTLKNRVGLGTVSFTNTGIVVSGIVTANSFSGPLTTTSIDLNGDLDVDGHTNLDNVSVAGVSTFADRVTISGGKDLFMFDNGVIRLGNNSNVADFQMFHDGGHTRLNNATGSLYINNSSTNGSIRLNPKDGESGLIVRYDGAVELFYDNTLRFSTSGVGATVYGNLDVTADLDVDGHTNLDNVSIAGVTTFSGEVVIAESIAVNRPRIVLSAPNDGTNYRHLFGANLQVNSSGTFTTPTQNISGGGWEYLPANSLNDHGNLRYLSAPDTNATSSTPLERFRIDSDGRIGVGVVPTAQYAHNLIQIGHQATLGANAALSTTGQTFLTHNLYFDTGGTLKVFNTSSANEGAIIRLVDGQFLFSNSAATTGTPTVTERVRITSAGDMGIGIVSPTVKLDVAGSLRLQSGGATRTLHMGSHSAGIEYNVNGTTFIQGRTDAYPLAFRTNSTERLRITSDGSVNIGGDYSQTSRKFKVTGNSTFDGGIVFTGTLEGSGFSVNGGNVIMPAFITHDGDSNTKFGFAAADRFTVETAGNERLRIDENGKIIVATGTLHSTRVLARFGIDCHGMNIFDGVGTVANYGMAFYNDPNTNYANGIGFFNDDGQTCGGYIVHQDKGSGNLGDIIIATSATSNTPVERLRISSLGNIKQNLTSPSGTSPYQNTHWYDRDGGNYTLTAIDNNYLSATKTASTNDYNDVIYKRVRMSKNCDIEFELSGNSPAGTYRHVGFVINGDGTNTHSNWDRLVFRSRPASTSSNQIRIDKGGGGYGFNVQSSDIPTFFDGTERHILIQLRDRLVNVIVDGEVIISQKNNADFNRSQGWFGFGIYEGGESANIVIRNLTIKNKFIQPHWLVRATGVNIDVNNGDPLPFNQVIKASSNMSNSSHYDNSSYRFNVPISGMYYCFVRAYRNSSNGSEVAFYVNGSVRNRFKPVPNGGDYIFAGSCLIQLLKGEYIDVRAYSANFGNFYGNSNQSFSSWGGHLID